MNRYLVAEAVTLAIPAQRGRERGKRATPGCLFGIAILAAACGGAGHTDPGAPCVTAADCSPGEICLGGRCVSLDAGADSSDTCVPTVCREECMMAGFASGRCTEQGCQCVRDTNGGDADVPGDATAPGVEVCGDGLDNDGDGEVDEDCICRPGDTKSCYDGDPVHAGVGICAMGSQVCNDDGEFGSWGPCSGAILPGVEVCVNGLDDDCDGAPDDGCACRPGETRACYTGPPGTEGQGICSEGTQVCESTADGSTWGPCRDQVLPQPDVCDGQDNDCDGIPDQLCACPPGAVQGCYEGPPQTRRLGDCRDGQQTCVLEPGGLVSSWGPCLGWVGPQAEVCDGRDNDCDGSTDPRCLCPPGASRPCYSGPPGTAGVGACRSGTQSCVSDGVSSDWGPCVGEVLPRAEICGDRVDNDCDGIVDDGCDCTAFPTGRPPTVTCPPNATTRALTAVTLTASAVDDCRIDRYRWEVIAAPAGSGATPASPNSISTSFTPDLVGEYRLRFTATDNEGLSASCEVRVTATGQGLRVELFWDIPGDVDLHLLHPSAPNWFHQPFDCYYGNMRPSWDAPGTADDPRLDIDDIPGDGPENINIDVPVTGHVYRVGVHHFRDDGCRTATIRIYCGDISIHPVATYTRRVCGNGGGGARDLWRVADVRWNGGDSCTPTTLGTVISDSAARSHR